MLGFQNLEKTIWEEIYVYFIKEENVQSSYIHYIHFTRKEKEDYTPY